MRNLKVPGPGWELGTSLGSWMCNLKVPGPWWELGTSSRTASEIYSFEKIQKRYGMWDGGFRNRNGNGKDVFSSIFSEFCILPEFYWISARPINFVSCPEGPILSPSNEAQHCSPAQAQGQPFIAQGVGTGTSSTTFHVVYTFVRTTGRASSIVLFFLSQGASVDHLTKWRPRQKDLCSINRFVDSKLHRQLTEGNYRSAEQTYKEMIGMSRKNYHAFRGDKINLNATAS